MTASNLFQGSGAFPFTTLDMTPHVVSDPAQKKGSYSQHPIFNAVGTMSSVSPRDTGLQLAAGNT